jgi:hypothetical protein
VFFVLNKHLRAQRRRIVVTVVLAALALSVTLAHSALGAGHMTMGGMDGHAAVAMCVAIGETAALAIVAVALIAVGLQLRRLPLLMPLQVTALPRRAPRDLRARSSPVRLQVMRH